jgi:helix-turn-helix protein
VPLFRGVISCLRSTTALDGSTSTKSGFGIPRNPQLVLMDIRDIRGKERFAMKSEWLTAREAAGIVRVHPVTLLKWARLGKVPHRRLSARKIVFPLSQLTAWLETGSYTDPVGHAAQPERTAA